MVHLTCQNSENIVMQTLRNAFCHIVQLFLFLNLCVFECVLFRPPGPASAGRGGLYILLLYFFDNRCYSPESAKQAPGDTIPTVGLPAELIKYLHTFDPRCPPFLQGGQNGPNFGQNFDPDRLWTAVFLKSGALSEIQNKLVKDQ